jgi:uracil phosphoribosyltransferase
MEISLCCPLTHLWRPCKRPPFDGKKLALISILRAGTGILDGMLQVVPGARVGHIGMYRDPDTLQADRVLLQSATKHA